MKPFGQFLAIGPMPVLCTVQCPLRDIGYWTVTRKVIQIRLH